MSEPERLDEAEYAIIAARRAERIRRREREAKEEWHALIIGLLLVVALGAVALMQAMGGGN